MKQLKLLLIITLLALPFTGVQSQTQATEQLKATIEKYILSKLQLSKDELLLEFTHLEKQSFKKIVFDKIKVLPSHKLVHKGLQIIKC